VVEEGETLKVDTRAAEDMVRLVSVKEVTDGSDDEVMVESIVSIGEEVDVVLWKELDQGGQVESRGGSGRGGGELPHERGGQREDLSAPEHRLMVDREADLRHLWGTEGEMEGLGIGNHVRGPLLERDLIDCPWDCRWGGCCGCRGGGERSRRGRGVCGEWSIEVELICGVLCGRGGGGRGLVLRISWGLWEGRVGCVCHSGGGGVSKETWVGGTEAVPHPTALGPEEVSELHGSGELSGGVLRPRSDGVEMSELTGDLHVDLAWAEGTEREIERDRERERW
jgi:hypothetical protein